MGWVLSIGSNVSCSASPPLPGTRKTWQYPHVAGAMKVTHRKSGETLRPEYNWSEANSWIFRVFPPSRGSSYRPARQSSTYPGRNGGPATLPAVIARPVAAFASALVTGREGLGDPPPSRGGRSVGQPAPL